MNETLEQLEQEFDAAKNAAKELAVLEKMLPYDPARVLQLGEKVHGISEEIRDSENVAYSLLLLGKCYVRLTDYKNAQIKIQDALDVFEKLKNQEGIARSWRLLSELQLKVGNYAESLELSFKALEIFEKFKNEFRIVNTLNSIANVYQGLGNYTSALEYYLRCLEFRDVLESADEAVLYNNVGSIYMNLNDYSKALEYFNQSLSINVNRGNTSGKAFVLSNIGKLYELRNELEEALDHQLRALELQKELGNRYGEAFCLQYVGSIYEKQSDFVNAKSYFRKCLEIASSIKSDEVLASVYAHLGRVYLVCGEIDEAIRLLNQALKYAKEIGQKSGMYRVHHLLSTAFQNQKKLEEALIHHKKYAEIKDELISQEKQRTIAEMQVGFEIEKAEKEKEIYRLKAAQAEQATEYKSKELTIMAMNLVQKNEFLSKLKDEVQSSARSADGAEKKLANTILKKLDQGIDSESEWKIFEQQFLNVHQDFINDLSKQFPTLTPTELKICSLIKIGLSSKEIGNLLFITHRTVELHRTRIRKKLQMPHQTNLTSYLASL